MSNQSKYSSGTPTTNSDITTVVKFAQSQMMLDIHTVKVCTIVEQTGDNSYTIRPAVSKLTTTGDPVDAPLLYDIPSAMIMGGSAGIILYFQPGDLVMVGCCDRNSDAAINNQGQANPQTGRKFSQSDSIIIGKVAITLPTTYVKILQETIEISAPTKITLISSEIDLGDENLRKVLIENVEMTATIGGVQAGSGVSGVPITITLGGSSVVKASE